MCEVSVLPAPPSPEHSSGPPDDRQATREHGPRAVPKGLGIPSCPSGPARGHLLPLSCEAMPGALGSQSGVGLASGGHAVGGAVRVPGDVMRGCVVDVARAEVGFVGPHALSSPAASDLPELRFTCLVTFERETAPCAVGCGA